MTKTFILILLSFMVVSSVAYAQTDETPPMTDAELEAAKAAKIAEGEKAKEDKTYTVTADVTEGTMDAEGRVIHAIGNVVITHSGTIITCNEAWSYEEQNLSVLKGSVKVDNSEKEYVLTSEYAEYHRDTEDALASNGPKLILKGENDIVITSDIMRMNMETEDGEAAGNCEVRSDDVTAVGDTLHYYGGGDDERIILDGSPVVWQDDSRLAGRLITMHTTGGDINRILVEEEAHLVYFAKEEEEQDDGLVEENLDEKLDVELGLVQPPEGEGLEGEEPESDTEPIIEEEEGVLVEDDSTSGNLITDGGVLDIEGEGTDDIFGTDDTVVDDTENSEDDGNDPSTSGSEEAKTVGKIETMGDVIDAMFIDGEIDKVIIEGDARGFYNPYDDLGIETGEKADCSGDKINVTFRNGDARKILVTGNAVGVLTPPVSEGRSGLTRSEGDTISIYISDNDIRRMVIYGGAHGNFYTEVADAEEGDGAESGDRKTPTDTRDIERPE